MLTAARWKWIIFFTFFSPNFYGHLIRLHVTDRHGLQLIPFSAGELDTRTRAMWSYIWSTFVRLWQGVYRTWLPKATSGQGAREPSKAHGNNNC